MGNPPVSNLFDQFDAKPAPTTASPESASATAPANLFSQFEPGATPPDSLIPPVGKPVEEQPQKAEPTDLFKTFDVQNSASLSADQRAQSAPGVDAAAHVDEPWYSQTWDFLNKPLYDAHQWGQRTGAGTIERGIESGVEDIISGLTSPLSLALTVGTLGGDLALQGSVAGLKTIGVAAADAPVVARGIKALADLGFTAQAIQGVITQSPQVLDALKDGDYETAAHLATNVTAGGALAILGAKHGFEDASAIKDWTKNRTPQTKETLATAKKIAGKLDEDRVVGSQLAKETQKEIRFRLDAADASDEVTQGAIRKYINAGGDVNLIKNQHDALDGALPVRQDAPGEGPKLETKYPVLHHGTTSENANAIRRNGINIKLSNRDTGGSLSLTKDPDVAKEYGETLLQFALRNEAKIATVKDIPPSLHNKGNFDLKTVQSWAQEHGFDGFDLDSLKKDAEGNYFDTYNSKEIRIWNPKIVDNLTSEEANKKLWNKDFLYHATDMKNADMIRNAGIKGPKQKVAWYADSPEEALNGGVTPVSGNRADLRVFAVPRDEVESSLNKTGFKPDPKDVGAANKKFTATNETHMPSHEIVVNDQGRPTGDVVPLRGDVPLTLDNTRFQSEYNPEEKAQLLEMYKKAQNLTPEQIEVAKYIRSHYEEQFNKANSLGMVRSAVENYHPQAWAKDRPGVLESLFGVKHDPTDNSAFNSLRHQTDNGAFDTNIAAAKQRAFETEFQGEMAGWKNKSNDLSYHAADYQMKLDRAIAARNFLESMRASGARASDGRPMVAMAGSSKVVGADSENPALLVNPNNVRSIQINDKLVEELSKVDPKTNENRLQGLIANGTIEKLPWTKEVIDEETGEPKIIPQFAWSTDGYQTIDHPAMRDWHYLGKDTAGNNAIMKSQMRVHPEAADYVRQVVGADVSKFRNNPYLKTLMAAQREAKGALLSFSPFHAVQEGLRGLMLGINPFDWKPVDVANDPVLRLGVRNNLTFPDYKAQDMFSEGSASHSKLIGKIPGLNKIQDYIQEFTFDKLIPSLKARGFKSVFARFQEKMPGAGADEVAHAAAQYVNDTFGGVHWRDLGVSATSQDAMRAIALAPDWLTSEIRSLWRFAGGMGKPAASLARADMTRLVAGMFVTSRVLNMLTSGKMQMQAPFGIVMPGQNGQDDKVYSMRTLPTDLIHVMTSPREFVMGRVNPLIVKTAIEGLTQRDQFGRKVTGQQEFSDFYHNFIPIGGQALLKGNTGGLDNKDQAIKAAGATVYKYSTEAEKLAQEKASNHMPSGPVDDDQLEAHQRNIRMEDGLRNGEISRGDVLRSMPAREANTVIQQARMTPLQARFTRLPLKDALAVWEIATPKEKDDLHSLLWKKRVSYIQSHTGSQRSSDPTWQRMQKVMGDLHPDRGEQQ